VSLSTGYFYQHLPWNFITKFHEGVVIHKDGILQRTFAYRAPDIDSSNQFEINVLALRVNDFAKRLGTGWAFHLEAQRFQLQEYPRVNFDTLAPYLIDRERESSFRAAGRHFDSSYYLTFTWKPPSENIKKLVSLFVQSGGSATDGMSVKQNVEFFVNETNAVVGLLSNELLLAPLNDEETVTFLHSTISFYRHPIRFPYNQLLLDRILPDSALNTDFIEAMKLGDQYIPIIGVNDFPEDTYPAILDRLNRARLEYRWVTRYICTDKEAGAKETRKKEKAHRGSRTTVLQSFAEQTTGEKTKAVNHGASVKEQDSIEAGIEIETDQAALGYLTTSVMVWDPHFKKAYKKADLVKTIINSEGFTANYETYNALEAFKAMMPGNVYSNYRALPVMSYIFSHVVPLSSVWAGFRHNEHTYNVTGVDAPHLVCSTAEGTPFFLNLNVGDVGHSAVWGPTGAGKSTLLNLLEMQVFKYPGSLVVVFDKGRSCRQPCLASGGRFYEPAGENSSGVNFQPLRHLETDRDMADAIDFIEACITVNGTKVTPLMGAAIKDSLEQLRGKPVSSRTITGFLQYVNYQDPDTRKPMFREMLGDYLIAGGKYGKIFDAAASDISLDTRFLAIEMEALMNRGEGCVVPALVYLFNLVEKNFDGRLALLILDEAWLFLKNETFADKIAEWLKVLRKKNVYVIFATQDVADVANSPLKTTIIQQCLTKIYLADPSASTPFMTDVYRSFGLSDSEISLIAHARMKRDYFYTSPAGRRLFQLDLGPLTLALIGSPDHALLNDLASHYETGEALCAQMLDAKRIAFRKLLAEDAPLVPEPTLRMTSIQPVSISVKETPFEETLTETAVEPERELSKIAALLEAVALLPERKKNDGSGRAAASIARQFGVSQATVYQVRKVLKLGSQALIDALRQEEIPVKTAFKRLKNEQNVKDLNIEIEGLR
jgi:type IV secretion system protein VirB4